MVAPINEPFVQTETTRRAARLMSASVRTGWVDPLHFLRVLSDGPRIYWRNGSDGPAYAGAGAATTLSASGPSRFASIRQELCALFEHASLAPDVPSEAQPRIFGGFSYYPDTVNGIWAKFSPSLFIMPHIQLMVRGDETWVTVSIVTERDPDSAHDLIAAQLDRVMARLSEQPPAHPEAQPALDFKYLTQAEEWKRMVEEATQRIQRGELEKVVLARAAEAHSEGTIDPIAALAQLDQRYPETKRFLIEPVPGHAFFGATPELLARIEGRRVSTDALAGSTRRGATPDEDAALGRDLMADSKERHEHALVVTSIRESLGDLCSELAIEAEPSVRQLRNIQHLHTAIEARLNDGVDALHVVEALHPTPALGGSPRDVALDLIAALEGQPRGWYGAPVGWLDAQGNGEFAVAIRAAVSAGNVARLYAGAGIVGDSRPEAEWQETALKFRPLLDALAGGAA